MHTTDQVRHGYHDEWSVDLPANIFARSLTFLTSTTRLERAYAKAEDRGLEPMLMTFNTQEEALDFLRLSTPERAMGYRSTVQMTEISPFEYY